MLQLSGEAPWRSPGCLDAKTIGCPATLGYVHRLIGPAEQGAFMHSMIGYSAMPMLG